MTKAFTQGHALVVGVGDDLPNTVMDAEGIAGILTDKGRCAYPPKQVLLLTGKEAQRADICSGLDALSEVGPESSVIIYFSGHGYCVENSDGKAYYLMPFGYKLNKLEQTAISGSEFAKRLGAIKAQKLLLLLDCCHAGGLGETKAPGLTLTKSPLPAEAQSLMAAGSGRIIIASSQEDELSYAGDPYSAFTLALVEALSGIGNSKNDGYVRVSDLALHAREMVPQRTDNKQHPILSWEKADNFIMAYYAGGEAKPKGLPFDVEPRIEPRPGAGVVKVFDQTGQQVETQVNVEKMSGGFIQPGWVVHGNVNQAQGDIHISEQTAKSLRRKKPDENS
ncbi:MAG TPA: caspase family protein [Pyrinomonadaceae bacterium]|jgi:hypothetical protein